MLWLQRASRKSSYAPRNYYSTKSARRNGGIKGCSDSSKFSFWRPVYMDWSVLAGFGITFSVLGHNGLATSRVGLHYLWTYGPTALLTLIASFWSRVECQAKISAPWCRMLEGETTSQQSVLLDYVSQFQPFALYTAVKNKDYSVAASTVASLLLRLTIVVSTSFIVLSPTNIQMKDVEVTLDSQFIDDPSGLSTNGVLAYAALIAMISKNTSLPDGISAEYAYVQAEADVSNILELKTTVDGFEGGLYCSPATLSAVSTTESNPIHLKLESDMCEIGFFEGCFYGESHRNGADVCNSFFIQERECTGPKNTLERAIGVVVSAIVSNYSASPIIGPHHLTDITILQANSFICMPRYQIKPIETVKTSANVKVSALTNATYGRLSSVSPWDIWDAHFDAIPNPANAGMSSTNLLSGELIEFDKLSWLVYLWANRTQSGTPLNYSSLLSGDTILQHFSSYYQQITAILARVSLMKDISAPSTGSAIVSKERLLVQIVPACVMMGLLSLSAAMVIIILWRQPKLLLPHSPNTVIGNAVLLAHNPLRLAEVGSISISDLKTVMNRWLYRIDKVRTNAPNNYQSSFLIDQKRSMHNDMATQMFVRRAPSYDFVVGPHSMPSVLI
ncbi:hypothetical protein F4777DRAFT_590208 [Nemania sp. FL0916]|nr:hypothetical protein F4777DRAFT_590208 [Nemania sp. FL0916]